MTRVGAAPANVAGRGRARPGPGAQAQLIRWGTLFVLIAAWEVAFRGPFAGNAFIAPPSEVVTAGFAAIADPANLAALATTTVRFLIAFAIVGVAGPLIGLGLGRLHRQVFLASRDVVTVVYGLPLVPFYPLFVLWVGLGMPSEIAFGVIHGIVPVILLVMSASAGLSPDLITSGRTMGATGRERLAFIMVPALLPDIVGALKIGATLSLLGVLLGELMISVDGVGTFVSTQIDNHRAAPLDAMILVVCVGVVVVNAALSAVETSLSRWRSS